MFTTKDSYKVNTILKLVMSSNNKGGVAEGSWNNSLNMRNFYNVIKIPKDSIGNTIQITLTFLDLKVEEKHLTRINVNFVGLICFYPLILDTEISSPNSYSNLFGYKNNNVIIYDDIKYRVSSFEFRYNGGVFITNLTGYTNESY